MFDQKIIIVLICVVLFLLFLTIAVFVLYSGIVYDFVIGAGTPSFNNMLIYYKAGEGSYTNTGAVFSDVASLSPVSKSIAAYYDNPEKVRC